MTFDPSRRPDPASRREVLRIAAGAAATPVLMSTGSAALAQARSASLSGVIRVCGTRQMKPLMDAWGRAFMRRNPGIHFDVDLKGTPTAQFGLQADTADIALSGREIYPYEYYGIYRRSQLLTVEIPVATGSYNQIGKSAALAIFVHADNPITRLSMPQLDRVFGGERSGGWQGMDWNTDVARGPETNIRTWGQLGLRGEWANAEITPYGPPALHPGGVSYFQRRVMGGADVWNERLREFPDRSAMLRALANDRYGIAFASLGYAAPGIKALALAERDGGPYFRLDAKTVSSRAYPLSRFAYMYLAPDTVSGDPVRLNPNLRAFLEFVLGRDGQPLISATSYYPLPLGIAAMELAKVRANALPTQTPAAS